MRELERFDLDVRALEYLRTQLHGINAFCTALEALIDGGGAVFTFAPRETQLERLYRFEDGGLLPASPRVLLEDGSSLSAVSNLRQEQAKWLWEQLDPAVCIVDDFNPRWSDVQTRPYFADMPRAFGVGEEVYHLLRHGDGMDLLKRAVRHGDNIWHGVTAICAHAPQIASDRTASLEDLQACAASATVITCTAYDGEGFVAWQRK